MLVFIINEYLMIIMYLILIFYNIIIIIIIIIVWHVQLLYFLGFYRVQCLYRTRVLCLCFLVGNIPFFRVRR